MAGARCSICAHPERTKIEALVTGGNSMSAIATQFRVDRSQLSRHMNGGPNAPPHVSDAEKSAYLCGSADVLKLRKLAAEENGTILEDLQLVKAMCFRQLHDAATVKDSNRFAALAGRFLDILEILGQRTGEIARLNPGVTINQNTTVSITTSPQFVRLQRALMRLVMNHPQLRGEIADMLRECEGEEARGELLELEASCAA